MTGVQTCALPILKKPGESKYPWDYYHVRATIPAQDAVIAAEKSECPLMKK